MNSFVVPKKEMDPGLPLGVVSFLYEWKEYNF